MCMYHQCVHTGEGAALGVQIDAAVAALTNPAPKPAPPRFPGQVSRQEVMDMIEAEIPLWEETEPPRHALSVLWGKVRDMKGMVKYPAPSR
jgi:hypothetical protein